MPSEEQKRPPKEQKRPTKEQKRPTKEQERPSTDGIAHKTEIQREEDQDAI